MDKLIESKIEVYFGEVLGKHSEIFGSIEKEEMIFVSDNKEVVKIIEDHNLTNGFNPFDYTSVNFLMDGEDLDDMTVDEIIQKLINDK